MGKFSRWQFDDIFSYYIPENKIWLLVRLDLNSPVNIFKVMSSQSVYPNHTFSWAGLVF